jgi:hypothetical protein
MSWSSPIFQSYKQKNYLSSKSYSYLWNIHTFANYYGFLHCYHVCQPIRVHHFPNKIGNEYFFHLFSYCLLSFAPNFFSNERWKVRFTFSWGMATLGLTPSMSEYLKAKLIFWMLSSSVKPRSCLSSNIDPSLWWTSHLNETMLFWFLRF